jgi:LmbE family N-acetylglucosaminyl deacetylase
MKILVISPHADDETLGVGGTLIKRKNQGAEIAWINVTKPHSGIGWSAQDVIRRVNEVDRVCENYGIDKFIQLDYQASNITEGDLPEIIISIADVVSRFSPDEVFIPHWSDAHSDHRLTFEAAWATLKWFRAKSVQKVLAYETLSETNFMLPSEPQFIPNIYEDISQTLSRKIEIAHIYKSELEAHPFPRSAEAISALGILRGSASGFSAAEAFQLLISRNP